ncbi:hypothetical protein O3M35_012206 [Rhynocoris fuscipes]|uniref:Uncharacterized protein n=1 Tax=Rhynocoris fuscipes TaxID=488301 RepID=A0AAW1CSU7_9HEMI
MKSLIALLACVAFAAALDDGQWRPWADNSYAGNFRFHTPYIHPYIHRFKRDLITPTGVVLHDDGQWKPALDGSYLGSGKLTWAKGYVAAPHAIIAAHRFKRDLITPTGVVLHDDGQWKPALDGSYLGSGNLNWAKGYIAAPHAIIAHRLKRDLLAYYPHAYSYPLDAPHVALAKNAQLVQQATEGTRNILGGGIPLALPADTPEVAAGKVAHAIAHSHQKAVTAGLYGHYIY